MLPIWVKHNGLENLYFILTWLEFNKKLDWIKLLKAFV